MDANVSIDIGKNMAGIVEKLAAQIGTTADQVFPWYVQQAYLSGAIFLAGLAAISVLSVAALVYGVAKGKWKYGDPSNIAAGLAIAGGVGTFLCAVAAFVEAPNAATKVLNPKFHAMQMLTKDVGRMVGK